MVTPTVEHAANEHAQSPAGQRHDRTNPQPNMSINRNPSDDISVSQKMMSALSGSVLTSLLVTPLDVVRVRLQSQQHSPASHVVSSSASRASSFPTFANLPPNLGISSCCKEVFWVSSNTPYCVVHYTSTALPQSSASFVASASPSSVECAAEEVQRRTFTSTFDGLQKIAKNEGLQALWRGLSPTLLMAVPANVIYFAGYDYLRHSTTSPFRRIDIPDTIIPLIAGSTARVGAAFAVSPLEMFRTRMQASHSHSPAGSGAAQNGRFAQRGLIRSTADGVAELVHAKGIRALWTGVSLTLWRDVPFSAIYWWGYEVGRNALVAARERGRSRKIPDHESARKRRDSKSRWEAYERERTRENTTATLVDSFVAGAGSGAVAALITTPFDVGKTRQQTVRHSVDSASLASAAKDAVLRPEERSMPQFLWHIFKTEGLPGLFKGWAARLMKIAPSTAIMISTYELGKKWAAQMNDRKAEALLRAQE